MSSASANCESSISATIACTLLSAMPPISPASRNCQNSRVRPMEMPTPGSLDVV